ncbi:MAG: hypothetical protein V3W41_00970 [Planctomycetota bacterium]
MFFSFAFRSFLVCPRCDFSFGQNARANGGCDQKDDGRRTANRGDAGKGLARALASAGRDRLSVAKRLLKLTHDESLLIRANAAWGLFHFPQFERGEKRLIAMTLFLRASKPYVVAALNVYLKTFNDPISPKELVEFRRVYLADIIARDVGPQPAKEDTPTVDEGKFSDSTEPE